MGDTRIPAGAGRTILWIMLGIVAWGVFHAVGAWRLNHDVRRLFVVLACVAAFLAFWGVLLAGKWRTLHAERPGAERPGAKRFGNGRLGGKPSKEQG